ncbi:MAG: hypothetical protein U9P63_02025, partial [Patescibacteria group bacterium]|nr:hypothetical protein [Patescibacteria group bacterium]
MKIYALIASFLFLLSGILGDTAAAEIELSGKVEMFGAGYSRDKEGSKKQYGEIRFLPEILASFGKFSAYCLGDFRQDTGNCANGCIDDIVEKKQRWAM